MARRRRLHAAPLSAVESATREPTAVEPTASEDFGDRSDAIAAMRRSHGELLPDEQRARFSERLGPLPQVGIHTDAGADEAARSVAARAVTAGRRIYFRAGEYVPGTSAGDRLLAHELAHVIQSPTSTQPADPAGIVQPADPLEREAIAAESIAPPDVSTDGQSAGGETQHVPLGSDAVPSDAVLLRQPFLPGMLGPDQILREYLRFRAERARAEVVELRGVREFRPGFDLTNYLAWVRRPVPINVRFGDLGEGVITVEMDSNGLFQSVGSGALPLHMYGRGDGDTSAVPTVVLQIVDNVVTGVLGTAPPESTGSIAGLAAALRDNGLTGLAGWRGLNLAALRGTLGRLADGRITLPATTFGLDLAGIFTGQGRLQILDGEVTFDAEARLRVPLLDEATIRLSRDSTGGLSGTVRMAVRRAGIDGSLLASFGRGVLDIRGSVGITRENLHGSGTLLVTDEASAWAAVNGQLAQWSTAAGGPGSATTAPPTAAGAADQTAAPPRPLALAGWGLVDFTYRDWLHGRAQVIIDPAGDITSLGRVRIPREFQIFARRELPSRELGRLSNSVYLGGIWAGTVGIYLGGSVIARAAGDLGPLVLSDVRAAGAFSTRPGFPTELAIAGRLSARAGLSIGLDVVGYIAVAAQVPVLGRASEKFRREVARTELRLSGSGDLEAYGSAEAEIRRRKRGADTDYLLSGLLTAGGTASVQFSGTLSVKVPGHTWHLMEFDRRYWRLGSMQTSARFGNFRIGSDEPPAMRTPVPTIRPKALMAALLRDGGDPSPPGGENATASWTPAGGRGEQVSEAADPRPPVIPSDPRFGTPTVPPTAGPLQPQPPAEGGEPPVPTPVDQPSTEAAGTGADAGPSDAGPSDAGVPPIAGVPPQPPPPLPAPAEAPPEHAGQTQVQFDMLGERHQLRLSPGNPPILVMESAPGRLVLKLQRRFDPIDAQVRGDPIRGRALQSQRDVLAELIVEARRVEEAAAQLGYGDRFSGTVPGMEPLAARLRDVARQFEWRDLESYLPSEPVPMPPEQGEEPLPSTASQVLGMPYEQFLAHVLALQPAEALPLLREQRRYYDVEVSDINQYRSSVRQGASAEAQAARYRVLITRIAQLDLHIRRLGDLVRPESRPLSLPCFSPDTVVHTPSGVRRIDALREGEEIWTSDRPSGPPMIGRVTAVHQGRTLRLVEVRVGGETVRATGRHPFWVVESAGWVAAEELTAGSNVLLRTGVPAVIERVSITEMIDAPTVNLSVSPSSTYFVGPGIWVHNVAVRHYQWTDSAGRSVPGGNFKIYLGTNPTSPEWADCIYVGQTEQSIPARQEQHRVEAGRWLAEHPEVPDDNDEKRYYRFKSTMQLTGIITGLRTAGQADWLEQANMDHERVRRLNPRNFMNRRNEIKSTKVAVEAEIRADPIVRASGYCP